jgi:hypothetical protein
MPRTLKSVKQAEAIPNRHCKYVSAAAHAIPFKTTLDLARRPAWMAEPYSKAAEQELFKQKANIHVGQRKLLLSEIQLLTMYYKRNTIHPTVVYVGAAPGHHIRFLHILFPKIEFILYDGAPYEPALKAAAAAAANKAKTTYELHNSFFTDDTCREIAARKLQKLIFISDIRMGEDNKNRFEDLVGRDNAAQRGWVTWLDYLKLNRERTGASATDRRLASIGAILKEAAKPEYRLQSDSISPKGAPALEILDARRRIA